MRKLRVEKIMIFFSMLCLLIFSLSFLCMPYANEKYVHGDRNYIYLIGAMFWGSLILGYLLLFIVNYRRREALRRNKDQYKKQKFKGKKQKKMDKPPRKEPWGVFGCLSNIPAIISDCTFLISLMGCITYMAMKSTTDYLNYILFAIILFSFHMHCIFNGKNYRYIFSKEKGEIKK